MPSSSVLLAIASAGCFLALAHAAVNTPREQFRRATSLMAALAMPMLLLAPAAGVALLAPVLFSRRLANAPVPATVEELLERYPA
jgi:ABC-type transport system involved in cytochrome c biogenesis permease subunit